MVGRELCDDPHDQPNMARVKLWMNLVRGDHQILRELEPSPLIDFLNPVGRTLVLSAAINEAII
jgi:hypothetical protein